MVGKIMGVLHANEFQAVNRGYRSNLPHMNENMFTALSLVFIRILTMKPITVFCPGFQKGRVPSEKGTFSAVNGPSKGHN